MRTASAALALASLAAIPPARAHAFLSTSTPAVGSTVPRAPAEVSIHFTEEVEPAFSTIVVSDAAGRQVQAGAPHIAHGDATLLVVPLKPLAAGTYAVEWHATAVDTHRTQGRFTFTVAR